MKQSSGPFSRVKRVICKTWTGTFTNSIDPDQTTQNAASDQGLHCLLKSQEVMGQIQNKVPVQDHFSACAKRQSTTSAVSALIDKGDNIVTFGFLYYMRSPL